MKITELKCPKCNAALQRTKVSDVAILACTCGYGQSIPPEMECHGTVKYVQQLSKGKITTTSNSTDY